MTRGTVKNPDRHYNFDTTSQRPMLKLKKTSRLYKNYTTNQRPRLEVKKTNRLDDKFFFGPGFLCQLHTFRFYSSSTPSFKLIINSSEESLKFEEGKAVLMLPALKPVSMFELIYSIDIGHNLYTFEEFLIGKECFHNSIEKIFYNLLNSRVPGVYRFDFYIYTNGKAFPFQEELIQVYIREDDEITLS